MLYDWNYLRMSRHTVFYPQAEVAWVTRLSLQIALRGFANVNLCKPRCETQVFLDLFVFRDTVSVTKELLPLSLVGDRFKLS